MFFLTKLIYEFPAVEVITILNGGQMLVSGQALIEFLETVFLDYHNSH